MSAEAFLAARNEMKVFLEAHEPLAGVAVFIEREDEDIDDAVEEALDEKGLALVILSSAAGVVDETRGGSVLLRVTNVVALLENRKANASEAGHQIPSENALVHVIRALVGKEFKGGACKLSPEAFARAGDESGLLEHYIGFEVPVLLRAG